MKLIVTPYFKKQEKAVKNFLDDHNVEFAVVNEKQSAYKTTAKKQLTQEKNRYLITFQSQLSL